MSEDNHRTTLPPPYLEQDTGDAALPADRPPAFTSPVRIKVISYRTRNHDPDGVSAKALLDGLVHAGILADDSSEQIKEITFESRKSKTEITVIEIED